MIEIPYGPRVILPARTYNLHKLAGPASWVAQERYADTFYRQTLTPSKLKLVLQGPAAGRHSTTCRDAGSSAPAPWEEKLKTWLPLAGSALLVAGAIYNTSTSFKALSDQIGSNQAVILEKFKNVDTKFDNVDTKFANVDTKFANLDTKFDALGKRMDQFETRLSRLEDKLYVINLPEKTNS